MLFGDFLNPGNCFKLVLVPIPGMIQLPESAEFRRKATLLRRIAVLVFAAQKPPGKRIAGSGNSDARFSGNSGAQSSGNSDRFELAPSSQTLAAPSSSEGRDDRHAQTAR